MKSTRKINNTLQVIIHCAGILVFSVITGFLLLALVYMIPTAPMKQNMMNDSKELLSEGVYPALGGWFSNTLDNFTDTLMIGTAVYDSGDSVIDKSLNAYHPGGHENPIQDLTEYLRDENTVNKDTYTRYWHGYLIFLKPILYMTDYLMWRSINRVLQIILMIGTAVMLIKKASWKCAVPIAAAVFFARPNIVYYSLQYSTMFYISLVSVFILTCFYNRLRNKKLIYFFLIVGIVTNYFDFLTYPAVSLGLCLVICLMFEQNAKFINNFANTVKYSIAWVCGYGGMWVGKWTLGSLLLHRNVFTEAVNSITERSSSYASGSAITRYATIFFNVKTFFEGIYSFVPLMIFVAVIIIGIIQWRKDIKKWMAYMVNLLAVAAIPFVWFAVLNNHSFMHLYFTDRELVITVAALTAAAWRVDKVKQ